MSRPGRPVTEVTHLAENVVRNVHRKLIECVTKSPLMEPNVRVKTNIFPLGESQLDKTFDGQIIQPGEQFS